MRRLFERHLLGLVVAVPLLIGVVATALASEEKSQLYSEGLAAYEAGDIDRAYVIWKPLAENGYAVAQYSLGKLLDTGGGSIERNPYVASLWYREAAAQGVAAAQNNLGIMYARGRGVPPNSERAVELWLEAARQGHPMAQFNLGLSYFNGSGVEPDAGEAINWFRRAADGGIADAQFALGQIYREGAGVPSDPHAALAWYDQAARQGHQVAANEAGRLRTALGLKAQEPTPPAPTGVEPEPARRPGETDVADAPDAQPEPPPPIPGKADPEVEPAAVGAASRDTSLARSEADDEAETPSEVVFEPEDPDAEGAGGSQEATATESVDADTSDLAAETSTGPIPEQEAVPAEQTASMVTKRVEAVEPSHQVALEGEPVEEQPNAGSPVSTETSSLPVAQSSTTLPLPPEEILGSKRDFKSVEPEINKEGEVEWQSMSSPDEVEGEDSAATSVPTETPSPKDALPGEGEETAPTDEAIAEAADSATAAPDDRAEESRESISSDQAQVAMVAVKPPLFVPEPAPPRRRPDVVTMGNDGAATVSEASVVEDPSSLAAVTGTATPADANPTAPASPNDDGAQVAVATPAVEDDSGQPTSENPLPAAGYNVWLASTADESAANDFWDLVTRSYPKVFSKVSGSVQKVDLGDLGVYYRVVAGNWTNEDAARQVCLRIRLRQPDAFCKVQAN